MKSFSLGFIGGGRITRIFLRAFQNRLMPLNNVVVCDTNSSVLEELKIQFPEISTNDDCSACAKQEVVIIALHPPHIVPILDQIRELIKPETIVISLAPKISLNKMEEMLPTKNIARMIPNATSYINQGFNPICFQPGFNETGKTQLLTLLSTLGKIFETDEHKLESYALISAMLPTYFWFQWQELEKIGGELGLTTDETRQSIFETLDAANNLYFQSGLSGEEVIDLIPVKPIAEHEDYIKNCLNSKLLPLFEKIKA